MKTMNPVINSYAPSNLRYAVVLERADGALEVRSGFKLEYSRPWTGTRRQLGAPLHRLSTACFRQAIGELPYFSL